MAAKLCGVNHQTAVHYFHRLCEMIVYESEAQAHALFDGDLEVDESYFGSQRKGRWGRGVAGKTAVYGLLKGLGRCMSRSSRMPLRQRSIRSSSVSVLDASAFKHGRIYHSEAVADARNHMNGIDNFWH